MKYERNGTILEKVMFFKIFIDRSKGYTNLVMALMLGVTMLNSFLNMEAIKDTWLIDLMNKNLTITYILFVLGGILSLVGIGWLDTKIGARSEEMRNNSLHNPVTVEMLEKTRDIHKKIMK